MLFEIYCLHYGHTHTFLLCNVLCGEGHATTGGQSPAYHLGCRCSILRQSMWIIVVDKVTTGQIVVCCLRFSHQYISTNASYTLFHLSQSSIILTLKTVIKHSIKTKFDVVTFITLPCNIPNMVTVITQVIYVHVHPHYSLLH